MPEPATLGAALDWARQRIDAVDARVLLCAAAACKASTLVAFGERRLAASQWQRFRTLVERRQDGVPVAYLTAEREFYSRRFRVGEGVLIPRPETELLVEKSLELVHGRERLRVLDLGTGSGVLAVTLALELGIAAESVVAVDASSTALGYAAWNAGVLGARVDFRQTDWFEGLEGHFFDLIVSNPPYVREADEHLSLGDLRFEPRSALAAGADGLDDIRRIVSGARRHLAASGWLLIEHGYDQAASVRGLLAAASYLDIASASDLAGFERISLGRMAGAALDQDAAAP